MKFTTLENRISEIENVSKRICRIHGLPESLVGRQHMTTEQLEFLANQSEEDYQASKTRLHKILEAQE